MHAFLTCYLLFLDGRVTLLAGLTLLYTSRVNSGQGEQSEHARAVSLFSLSPTTSKRLLRRLEVDFLGTALKFRKKKKNLSSLVYVLHKTCN